MPLHAKDDIRNDLLDDIYASTDLSVAMPKYKIPEIDLPDKFKGEEANLVVKGVCGKCAG